VTLHEEGFDVVYAVRAKRREGVLKRMAYSLFYRVLRFSSNHVSMPRDSGDFALVSRRVADVMRSMPERNRFVRGLRAWAGFSQTGVPYERDARRAGKTKYSLRKLIRLAYDGIFSFSYVPITVVTIIGFLTAVLAFLGVLAVLYFRLTEGREVPGFAATATIILFFGGVQLMALGVLGEYIRRIYDEVKQRPHYVVREKFGGHTKGD
jgi:polyisoprenyl-phosphate glycosyltransferase